MEHHSDISTNVPNIGSSSKVEFLSNAHLKNLKNVSLLHLNLNRDDNNVKAMFRDVKFVCIGGTERRIKEFAHQVAKELGLSGKVDVTDLTASGNRYSMFKVGPVLCVNHGMGYPSVMILLEEVILLLHSAEVKNPIILRIGTSGAVAVPGGTIVITEEVVNDYFESNARIPLLGRLTFHSAPVDRKFANEIKSVVEKTVEFPLQMGKTMSTEHYHNGRPGHENVLFEVSEEERNQYSERLKENKIMNFEMESIILFAVAHRLGIKAACITVAERASTAEQYLEWELRPQRVALDYIKHYLKNSTS